MNERQVDRLLDELVKTRESFDRATAQIRWNKLNTAILYALVSVILVMIGLGVKYYFDQRRVDCERGNDLRAQIVISLDYNAAAIGSALASVSGASPEVFNQYMDAYGDQEKPPILQLRDC